jgi:hypothetical protein
MESLFRFNKDFEPEYINYNTTKMPFDLRWVSPQPSPVAFRREVKC